MATRWDDIPSQRCPDYRHEAASIDGLVQQVTVSYLRHGYFYYVSDVLGPKVSPEAADEAILTRYNIRKCWRYRAEQKAHGFANLQYIRYGRFYVIMATENRHRFKERERDGLRDARDTPLFVPITSVLRAVGKNKKKKHRDDPRIEEGYVVTYMRGRYERKTAEERAEYKKAWEDWKRQRRQGRRLPKPAKGKVKLAWHPTVAIEDESSERLRKYFLTYATKWKREMLEMEFRKAPYQPYWAVKRQLFSILCDVNDARHKAGLEQLSQRVVHGMTREQIFPFGEPEMAR